MLTIAPRPVDIELVEYRPRIMDLVASERPRERLKNHGPQALSNAYS